MRLPVVGVRRWADALFRLAREVTGVATATAWIERLRAAQPGLFPRGEWQAALALATVPGEGSAEPATARARPPAGPGEAPFEAPRRDATGGPPSSSSSRGRGVSERRGWVRPRERARRRRLGGDPLPPVAPIDPPSLSSVLARYAGRAHPETVPAAPRPRPSARALAPLPGEGSRWPLGLARRTAHRLLSSRGREYGPPGAPAASEPDLAAALARTLDAALEGVRVDPAWLLAPDPSPGGPGPREGRPEGAPEPAPGAAGQRASSGPLHPLGLASPDSAPAPEVPVSVADSPAGSASRVAPPTGAPALPPLLPAAIVQPPALGISAPSLRRATRPEDPEVEDDDRSALADSIRRILRGEARRHGITLG